VAICRWIKRCQEALTGSNAGSFFISTTVAIFYHAQIQAGNLMPVGALCALSSRTCWAFVWPSARFRRMDWAAWRKLSVLRIDMPCCAASSNRVSETDIKYLYNLFRRVQVADFPTVQTILQDATVALNSRLSKRLTAACTVPPCTSSAP